MKSILFLVALIVCTTSFAQNEPKKSPHDTVSNGTVTVTYGRPYKKGRDIFGGLEPYGKVWRLGADQATTITFAKDVKFGTQDVKAGMYTMFAIPTDSEWGFILNSQLNQWGAFAYEKNKDKNVARIAVPVKKLDSEVEQLTIRFAQDNSMIVEWDKTQVTVPIKY